MKKVYSPVLSVSIQEVIEKLFMYFIILLNAPLNSSVSCFD